MADPTVAELQQTITALREEKKVFRDNNIGLQKENDEWKTRYKDIDPVAVAADRAKLTAYETAKPDEQIAALKTKLAAAEHRANSSTLKDAISTPFLAAGGRANALDFMLSKAERSFTVQPDGLIVGSVFDPDRPGEKITVDAFINQQLRESDFAFKTSAGSGANPIKGAGARGNTGELRNPTARQLGEHAAAIRDGRIRVVHDEQ